MEHPDPIPSPSVPLAKPVDMSALGPSAPAERIVAIDVLRGFALLGILIMNIRSFAMIEATYFNPYAAGPLSRVDLAVWWLGELFADSKFITIFSMLFGAGVILMAERRDRAGLPAAAIHYRRMLGLWIIGMLHAYLIWYGDILVSYALCGCAVFLVRTWRPAWLLLLGVTLLLVGAGIDLLWYTSLPYWPAESVAEFQEVLQPPAMSIEEETGVYRGSWLEQLGHRAFTSFFMQTFVFLTSTLWQVSGVMLLGMALFKLGILTAKAGRGTYVAILLAGLLLGLPMVLAGLLWYPAQRRGEIEASFVGTLPNYWGSILVALGYTAAIMLLCRRQTPRWMWPLAAVGRTALSNYLLQSVVCTLLFYGHGLGLFGRVSWIGQIGIVVLIWAGQLLLSTLYLRWFRMGPVEAVWRLFTYWRWPVSGTAVPTQW